MHRYLTHVLLPLLATFGAVTTPALGTVQTKTLVAAGDIACPADAAADQCHHADTAKAIESSGADAVAVLGDTQYLTGAPDDFNNIFDTTWGQLKAPLHPVPGNHEYYTAGADGYFKYFGARAGDPAKGYYSYNLGAWHLIALNTNDLCTNVACNASSPQVAWLKADLKRHTNRCVLAYWHQPRFSSGEHGDNPQVGALWSVLYKNGADVVLNGHDHDYERFAPMKPTGTTDPKRGLREFVVGTGGYVPYAISKAEPNSVVHESATYGVLKLTLQRSAYKWTFVRAAGPTFSDTGSADCH